MPRTADPTDIPQRLTAAGHALFIQQGYNATGIQQIADEAGVPKGSFYNHFDSKEAFAAHVIEHHAQWVSGRWDACLQDAPSPALPAIRHLFQRFIQHHEQAGASGCLVGNFAAEVSESSEVCRLVLSSVMGRWRKRLADLIRQAQRDGSVRQDLSATALSGIFWDAWEGAVLRVKVEHRSTALHDCVHLMLDHFFQPPHPSTHGTTR